MNAKIIIQFVNYHPFVSISMDHIIALVQLIIISMDPNALVCTNNSDNIN